MNEHLRKLLESWEVEEMYLANFESAGVAMSAGPAVPVGPGDPGDPAVLAGLAGLTGLADVADSTASDWNASCCNVTQVEAETVFTWQNLIVVCISCVVIAVIVIGNTLVIVAVITTRRLRTITNCFVMSLAVADWLVGVFVLPPAVAYQLMGTWELGWVLCDLWVSLDVLLCTASILSLCAISVDRYLAVTQPLNYSRRRRSKRLALAMILVVWVLAAAITCPPILGWYEAGRNNDKTCRYNQNIGYVVYSAMGSFFLPLMVMLYVYARISCVVARRHDSLSAWDSHQTSRRLRDVNLDMRNPCSCSSSSDTRRHVHCCRCRSTFSANNNGSLPPTHRVRAEESGGTGAVTSSESTDHNYQPHTRNHTYSSGVCSGGTRVASFRRSESKTTKTLWMLVGGFVACWLPFFVVYLLTPFLPQDAVSKQFGDGLTWLGWINSAANPFIYAFYSPDFRLAFWRLTLRHCTPRAKLGLPGSDMARK